MELRVWSFCLTSAPILLKSIHFLTFGQKNSTTFILITYFSEKRYIIANYIGESLSAFVPGVLALLQNINNVELDDTCINSTNNSSNDHFTQNAPSQPLFSVSIFFLLMSLVLMISTFAFFLLNNTRFGKLERQKAKEMKSKNSSSANSTNQNNEDDELIYKEISLEPRPIDWSGRSEICETVILLSMVFVSSFIGYGLLPGLQTFSVMPYGIRSFNLAVNLSKFN